jgi:outer membrane protein OmpA-like peptidoglycan-associated protein
VTTTVRRLGLGFGIATAAGLLACAHEPPPELVAARNSYRQVAADPVVQQKASVPLYEARQALDRADRAFTNDLEDEEVTHLAYLASRRAEIARQLGMRDAAQEQAERLGQQRNEVLLDARTQEAEAQRQQAELARQQAESAQMRADELAKELEELQAKPTERGLVLTLGDVLFDVDRSELKPGAELHLARLVEFLGAHPERNVLIEGHTDSTGGVEYNLELSRRRADAVRSFLVGRGIAPSRIATEGYGLSRPIASNDSVAGRQQNRRVDIVVLNEGVAAGPPASSSAR